MMIFSHPSFTRHEQVSFIQDTATGLKAIIAIHSSRLGPALGGCRMHAYRTDDEALTDVLRLSESMSYKAALAGLPLGGGKSVIIGDPNTDKTPALLEAFGRAVEHLGGHYIVAEDAGTSAADMRIISRQTHHVTGLPDPQRGTGDPSPNTAYGVFLGLQAAVQDRFGDTSLQGMQIAVQGLGHVGMRLCALLHEAGAQLWVADPLAERVRQAQERFSAHVSTPEQIHSTAVDVFAPCALGASINDHTLPELHAAVVAGAANNQLLRPEHGDLLRQRGILYVPDYVLNAGGLIDVYYQHEEFYSSTRVRAHIERIPTTLAKIFATAREQQMATNRVADRLAKTMLL
ncbi:Glu/Leu/Phe/Val dehydrogenase dimerization domain-containing protein [Pokkaliibacter sp. MBI-7]|uniref:Leu/Phe/Val dehydrogenase n=1 Tax=Pokkaliibacter sp. MBI-7 TaxID=3040600 RepID=UPI00244716E8|nr:Glu/Leu/Phe/Val dehydrogenase dimerization domain-containing protein [Pokkaliibacter sp. MBI-7]MDH2431699.1 Glu/Leu/Phe/Val dehydrogenase dimerization domain-containing protein [Pokkaliibacter sp. MBI-7]